MIYRSHLQRLHSTNLVVIALMLKEIHHRGLMMLAFFSFQFFFAPFHQYVICGIYGLRNVKIVLNKATDEIPV